MFKLIIIILVLAYLFGIFGCSTQATCAQMLVPCGTQAVSWTLPVPTYNLILAR